MTAIAQLSRLLALIPWLLARPNVSMEQAATEFAITPAQLRKDLELAFLCGLPGHLPDDLIDVSIEGDRIVVSNADTIARPLRLAPDEAVSLLVGLRALSAVAGPDRDALDRTTAKLERAAGDAADADRRVTVEVESDEAALAVLNPALERGRRVHLRYYVPARDEVTDRDVDPIRLVVVDGRTYLEGWCRSAEDVRLFRLDRMAEVTVLEVAAEVPTGARRPHVLDGAYRAEDNHHLAVLEVAASGRWVADTFPVVDVTDRPDGSAVVRIRIADEAWLRRLMLSLGGAARVQSPPELAAAVQTDARTALAAYP